MRVAHATLGKHVYMDENLDSLIECFFVHHMRVPAESVDSESIHRSVFENSDDPEFLSEVASMMLRYPTDHIIFESGLSFHISPQGKITTKKGSQ